MKHISYLFLGLVLLLASCETTPEAAFMVEGQMSDAAGLKLHFDKTTFSGTTDTKGYTAIDNEGKFSLSLEEHPGAGVYRMRIGKKKMYAVLEGSEPKLEIKGTLAGIDKMDYTVSGSALNDKYMALEKEKTAGNISAANVSEKLKSTSGLVGALFSYTMFKKTMNETAINSYKAALANLKKEDPSSPNFKDFQMFVNSKDGAYQQFLARERIKVGKPALDIRLNSPDGKEYALSDLKGKVVLLDFWASWCGPCRRENPNVVKIYDKYNKQGFEVFSVSLDRSNGKQRWIDAIAKDDLKWPYHVSELQHWNSKDAKAYGVTGIPKTFLIDKEGNIAAVNPRGPALEPAVKKLL
ncbi:MAG: redoxin domain-containing protein [Saprospiraceae bacterium]